MFDTVLTFLFSIYLYICLKSDQFLIQYLSAHLSGKSDESISLQGHSIDQYVAFSCITALLFGLVRSHKRKSFAMTFLDHSFFPPNGIVQRLDRKVSVYTAQQKYISEPFRICLWEKDCKHTLNSRISRPAK